MFFCLISGCSDPEPEQKTKSSEKIIKSFDFKKLDNLLLDADIVGVINQTDKRISLTVPFGISLTSLVPTIVLSANAVVSPSSEAAQNFNVALDYIVTAEDGTTSVYEVSAMNNDPPPQILSIDPASGSFGMLVTINGVNFGTGLNENTVKFNGDAATIVSATSDKLVVKVPVGGSSGEVSVKTKVGEVAGPFFKYYDIFILGKQYDEGNGKLFATVWKNGIPTQLTTELSSGARNMAILGNDVYVVGFRNDAVYGKPGYWKNSVFTPIPFEGYTSAECTNIYFHGDDLYLGGSVTQVDEWGNPHVSAAYWKNGQLVLLPDMEDFYLSVVASISVINTDLYLAGEVRDSEHGYPVYWKNGEMYYLPDLEMGVRQIKSFGDDLHMLATGDTEIVHWKNGILNQITSDPTKRSFAFDMCLDDTDVYIAGADSDPANQYLPKSTVWKNGAKVQLPGDLSNSFAMAVANVDGNLVVTGERQIGLYLVIYYIFNDQIIYVTPLDQNAGCIGMIAR